LEEERKQREKEREQRIRTEKALRKRTLVAILSGIDSWSPRREDVLRLLDASMLEDLPADLDDLLQGAGVAPGHRYIDFAKLTDAQAHRLLLIVACADDFDDLALGAGCDKLNATAKRYGVNVEAIRKQGMEAEGGTRREVVGKLPVLGQSPKKSAPAKKKAPQHLPALLKKKAKKVATKKKAGKGKK
jgi:hypothetical protein